MLAYHAKKLFKLSKLGKPVDRHEWSMRASTVNAYYDNGVTALFVPAAVLQPPFFSDKYPAARNFGGIGRLCFERAAGAAQVVGVPWITQTKMRSNVYFVDPNILIEAEQQFTVKINYPSGAIPVIASGLVNDSTNPLKIGVIFDGLLLRPVQ
jgi:hypothetical protein